MGVRFALAVSALATPACIAAVFGGCSRPAAEVADAAPFPIDSGVLGDARALGASLDASNADALDGGADALDASAAADGRAVLHTYRRVLHIGDSMVGFKFGLTRALGARFEADGAKFFSIPVTSAGIQSFEKNTDLDDAIKKTHPDLVLITLGANNATSPQPKYLVSAIKKVVRKVGVSANPRRRCFWIGPPLWLPDKVGFIDVLDKATAPCTFFDSSKLVLERMSDGIHPTNKGGEVWAEAFYRFLMDRLAADPPPEADALASSTASPAPHPRAAAAR
jgi:hypothetical protein